MIFSMAYLQVTSMRVGGEKVGSLEFCQIQLCCGKAPCRNSLLNQRLKSMESTATHDNYYVLVTNDRDMCFSLGMKI